jgi:preprotein translocase subunit YajC
MISTFLFLAQAAAPTSNGGLFNNPIIPFACIGLVFYFMIIRPQKKKQNELQALVSALKTGDKVVTTGGIYGIIANVKEGSTLSLKIADNVKIEIDKSAIASVIKTNDAPAS